MIQQRQFTVTATVVDVSSTAVMQYRGFSVRETAGATAVVEVHEGSGSGDVLDTIALAANESTRELYPEGIQCNGDLCVVVTGTVVGSLRYA